MTNETLSEGAGVMADTEDTEPEWGLEFEGDFVPLDPGVANTQDAALRAAMEAVEYGADPETTFAAVRLVTPHARVIPPGSIDQKQGGVMADTEDTETLADSIGGCFSNTMDLPEWMQAQALGRSMRPLTLIAARAVLASSWLAARDERIRADERERLSVKVDP